MEQTKPAPEYPKRKVLRLEKYDYRSNGAYFITICTNNHETLFGSVGADSISARMVERTFLETVDRYEGVSSPKYVVMPDHFHVILLMIRADPSSAPTVSDIVRSFKRYSTIEYIKLVKEGLAIPFEKKLWQRSFYDHIIRCQEDYEEVYNYIENNPRAWESKHFHS